MRDAIGEADKLIVSQGLRIQGQELSNCSPALLQSKARRTTSRSDGDR